MGTTSLSKKNITNHKNVKFFSSFKEGLCFSILCQVKTGQLKNIFIKKRTKELHTQSKMLIWTNFKRFKIQSLTRSTSKIN